MKCKWTIIISKCNWKYCHECFNNLLAMCAYGAFCKIDFLVNGYLFCTYCPFVRCHCHFQLQFTFYMLYNKKIFPSQYDFIFPNLKMMTIIFQYLKSSWTFFLRIKMIIVYAVRQIILRLAPYIIRKTGYIFSSSNAFKLVY